MRITALARVWPLVNKPIVEAGGTRFSSRLRRRKLPGRGPKTTEALPVGALFLAITARLNNSLKPGIYDVHL